MFYSFVVVVVVVIAVIIIIIIIIVPTSPQQIEVVEFAFHGARVEIVSWS